MALARLVLDEEVALRQQAHQGELDRVVLALDDRGDVTGDGLEPVGEGFDGARGEPGPGDADGSRQ
jgi:hypothetical protein